MNASSTTGFRSELATSLAIQGGGALSVLLATVWLGAALGPRVQGEFSHLKSTLEFVGAFAAFGLPQALFFHLRSGRIGLASARRWVLAATALAVPIGALVAAGFGGFGDSSAGGPNAPATSGSATLVVAAAVAVAAFVAQALLRALLLGRASAAWFNLATAAPQLATLAGIGLAIAANVGAGRPAPIVWMLVFAFAYGSTAAVAWHGLARVAPAAVPAEPIEAAPAEVATSAEAARSATAALGATASLDARADPHATVRAEPVEAVTASPTIATAGRVETVKAAPETPPAAQPVRAQPVEAPLASSTVTTSVRAEPVEAAPALPPTAVRVQAEFVEALPAAPPAAATVRAEPVEALTAPTGSFATPPLPADATIPPPHSVAVATVAPLLRYGLAAWLTAALATAAILAVQRWVDAGAGAAALGRFTMAMTLVQVPLTPIAYAAPLLFRRWMQAPGSAPARRWSAVLFGGLLGIAALVAAVSPWWGDLGLGSGYAGATLALAMLLVGGAGEAASRLLAVQASASGRPWQAARAEAARAAVLGLAWVALPAPVGLQTVCAAWAGAALASAAVLVWHGGAGDGSNAPTSGAGR